MLIRFRLSSTLQEFKVKLKFLLPPNMLYYMSIFIIEITESHYKQKEKIFK